MNTIRMVERSKMKVLRITTALGLLLFSEFSCGQEQTDSLRNYIISHAVGVRSIDAEDADFSDLEPFRSAIGDARMVMLGEQDHGDATAFQAKARLVRFLHEQCGFDVLAFESDFYSLNVSWEKARKGMISPREVYAENVYSVWAKCNECQSVFSLIDGYFHDPSPLIVTGFDCRHSGDYSKKNYVRDLDSTLKTHALPVVRSPGYADFIRIIQATIEKEYGAKIEPEQQQKTIDVLDSVKTQLNAIQFAGSGFWVQEVENLGRFLLNAWGLGKAIPGIDDYKIRDTQMAKNLLWLANQKYPDKKIIIWAHSIHVAKNVDQVKVRKDLLTMGDEVWKVLKDEVFILGFSSYQGKSGRIQYKIKTKLEKPSKNSFEEMIATKGFNYAFIDFKKGRGLGLANQEFIMKGAGHNQKLGRWMNVFDGVFYIREMYPCTRIE